LSLWTRNRSAASGHGLEDDVVTSHRVRNSLGASRRRERYTKRGWRRQFTWGPPASTLPIIVRAEIIGLLLLEDGRTWGGRCHHRPGSATVARRSEIGVQVPAFDVVYEEPKSYGSGAVAGQCHSV